MPAFHYTSLNKDNKTLSGVVEAVDEQSARKKMNSMGLSVISLNLAADEKHAPQEGRTVFEFEAIDKINKKVTGTITAEDIVKAFAKLFDEYQLNVIFLAPQSSTPDEKEELRKAGIIKIQQEYEKLYAKETQKNQEDEELIKRADQRKELIQKVDYTMQRIEVFLKQYNADLKTEERDAIQAYLNQLMRIKDSTNLEHIKNTCEKMLAHIQRQELFIHEEQKAKESAGIKAETQEMLSDIKHGTLTKDINIGKILEGLKEKPFLKPIINFLLNLSKPKNPEMEKAKDEIKATNKHIWSYIRIFIFAKSKLERNEAWTSIKSLFAEKKRLKLKSRVIEYEERKLQSQTDSNRSSAFWESTASAIGWILAFYIVSYAASYLFTIKSFQTPPLPKSIYFYHSTFLKGITIFLFLAYGTIQARNFWLKNHWSAAYLLYPASIFAFLLIVINLM
ncbi:MAG: hypothetical protein AAB739_04955 [Patescibacteria group bacterium]